MLCRLQDSYPARFLAEGQYVESPGCDRYGIKKQAEREQMKITTCIFIYFVPFALTFKFRKYIFSQETFQLLCQSPYSLRLPNPIALDAGKVDFFKKINKIFNLIKCLFKTCNALEMGNR